MSVWEVCDSTVVSMAPRTVQSSTRPKTMSRRRHCATGIYFSSSAVKYAPNNLLSTVSTGSYVPGGVDNQISNVGCQRSRGARGSTPDIYLHPPSPPSTGTWNDCLLYNITADDAEVKPRNKACVVEQLNSACSVL